MLLEEDAAQRNKVPTANPDLLQMSSTPEGDTSVLSFLNATLFLYLIDKGLLFLGALVLGLVLDFLQTHHLEFSKSVFEPECAPVRIAIFFSSYPFRKRKCLIKFHWSSISGEAGKVARAARTTAGSFGLLAALAARRTRPAAPLRCSAINRTNEHQFDGRRRPLG